MLKTDVLVIGAGAAGLGIAHALAVRGLKVCVLERETRPARHASGRNAGMIRQAIADPLIARLAVEGRNELAALVDSHWPGVRFRPIGSLLLAANSKIRELSKIAACLEHLSVPVCAFDSREASQKVSLLNGADFRRALFCPSDGVVEIGPLFDAMALQAARLGVKFVYNRLFKTIEAASATGIFTLRLSDGTILKASRVINAAGAWASLVGQRAGASKIPLVAYRRHLFESGAFGPMPKYWPFVWDLSASFYFRPEGRGLLLSACDQEAVELTFADNAAAFEKESRARRAELVGKLRRFSFEFGPLKLLRGKAGLRTISADERFVLGEDPRLKGFYWAAGLGGHGVTTAFAVGRYIADLLTGKKADPELNKAFSPARFG